MSTQQRLHILMSLGLEKKQQTNTFITVGPGTDQVLDKNSTSQFSEGWMTRGQSAFKNFHLYGLEKHKTQNPDELKQRGSKTWWDILRNVARVNKFLRFLSSPGLV